MIDANGQKGQSVWLGCRLLLLYDQHSLAPRAGRAEVEQSKTRAEASRTGEETVSEERVAANEWQTKVFFAQKEREKWDMQLQ